jgi:hypothetical protein
VLAFEDAMLQMDPWEKAADCERALRLTVDPVHRNKLKDIRGSGRDFTKPVQVSGWAGTDWT